MPRVRLVDHYQRHQLLRRVATRFGRLEAPLSIEHLRELAQFYEPFREHSLESLAAHIKRCRIEEPSLAHRVGKHYKAIELILVERLITPDQPAPKKRTAPQGTSRQISIRAIHRDKPDTERVARVLLEMAKQMREDQNHNKAA